jgi:hypothetical protein
MKKHLLIFILFTLLFLYILILFNYGIVITGIEIINISNPNHYFNTENKMI